MRHKERGAAEQCELRHFRKGTHIGRQVPESAHKLFAADRTNHFDPFPCEGCNQFLPETLVRMHQGPEGNIDKGVSALLKGKGLFRSVIDRGAHKVIVGLRKARFLRLKVPQRVNKIVRRRFPHQRLREILLPQRKLREKEAA